MLNWIACIGRIRDLGEDLGVEVDSDAVVQDCG